MASHGVLSGFILFYPVSFLFLAAFLFPFPLTHYTASPSLYLSIISRIDIPAHIYLYIALPSLLFTSYHFFRPSIHTSHSLPIFNLYIYLPLSFLPFLSSYTPLPSLSFSDSRSHSSETRTFSPSGLTKPVRGCCGERLEVQGFLVVWLAVRGSGWVFGLLVWWFR